MTLLSALLSGLGFGKDAKSQSRRCPRRFTLRNSLEQLEGRTLLDATNDLFVITHGFQLGGGFPQWVYDMASAISTRLPTPCPTSDTDDDKTPDSIENARFENILETGVFHRETQPTGGCPQFLLFDWADESDQGIDPQNGKQSAVGAAERLAGELAWRLSQAPAPLNIHFIGHSRGAVVNSEAIRIIDGFSQSGKSKIGFLQMTTLDPHPSWVYGDPDPVVTQGVVDFADNYYETIDVLPDIENGGMPITGAVNVNLTAKLDSWPWDWPCGGRGDPFPNHAEVHDWYHWTIDLKDTNAYAGVPPINDRFLGPLCLPALGTSAAARYALYSDIGVDDSNLSLTGAEKLGFQWSILETNANLTDDFVDSFPFGPPTLHSSLTWNESGRIEVNGDVDFFQFFAPASGQLTITQRARPGSALESMPCLYDGSRIKIAADCKTGTTSGSSRTIEAVVVGGQAYYARAAAFPSLTLANRVGAYTLEFNLQPPQPLAPEVTVFHRGAELTDGTTSPIDFGTIGLGQSGPTETFTVRNDGTDTLTLGRVTLPTGFRPLDDLRPSLAPNESDSFTVLLETATVGDKQGRVSFTTNDASEILFDFPIHGEVRPETVTAPEIKVQDGSTEVFSNSSTTFDLGTIGQGQPGPTKTFTIRNVGNAPLSLVLNNPPPSFVFLDGVLPSLERDGSDNFTIQLDTSTIGTKQGVIQITTNDSDEGTFNISVSGTVATGQIGGPEITVRQGTTDIPYGSTLDLGTTDPGQSLFRIFTIRNDGTAPLSLGAVTVTAGFTIEGSLIPTLNPRETASFVARVNTVIPGPKSGEIRIGNNDPDESPFHFFLRAGVSGTATPDISVRLGSVEIASGQGTDIDIGTLAGQGWPERTFVVENVGTTPLTLTEDIKLPTGFRIASSQFSSLVPGDGRAITIQLNSEIPGFKFGEVSFITNDPDESPFTFLIHGVGSSASDNQPPVISPISDRTITEGTLLTFAVEAGDTDHLSYSLGPGAPEGARLEEPFDSTQPVVFRWTPNEGQGGTTYRVTVFVTDNGRPNETSQQSLNITVLDAPIEEFRVNMFTAEPQHTSPDASSAGSSEAVAMDANGNFVVTWTSDGGQDGEYSGVYAQRYNAAGSPQDSEFRVNTTTAGNQLDANIAMDAHGDFVIVWAGFNADNGILKTYAQRYNAAGVPQGGEFQVNTTIAGGQLSPRVAMAPDGGFVVVWQGSGIHVQRYDVAGRPIGGAIEVTNAPGSRIPDIAEAPDGSFVVAWEQGGIKAKLFDVAGVSRFDEFTIGDGVGTDRHYPRVAMDSHGDFAVTWASLIPDDRVVRVFDIYAQQFSAAGLPQGPAFPVNTYGINEQRFPAVGMAPNGEFVITWASNGQTGDMNRNEVYGQRFDAAGVPQGTEFRANSTISRSQSDSSVAMDGRGHTVIVWDGNGPGDTSGVFSRRYFVAPPAGTDTDGPKVMSIRPNSLEVGVASTVRVTFNEPIDPSSFRTDDISEFFGPGGTIQPTDVTLVDSGDGREFDIVFAALQAPGPYSVVVGANILDRSGNLMDQNGNKINGEGAADRFTGAFTLREPDTTPPTSPSGLATSPGSPANNNNPKVLGAAEAGSAVNVYTTSDCSGSPVATGTAATFASPGFAVSVGDDTTTTFKATAIDAAGNPSACSAGTAYVEDSTPPDVLNHSRITRKGRVTGIVVTFSEKMLPAPAGTLRNFLLTQPGKRGRPRVQVPLASIQFDGDRTVTLTLARPVKSSVDLQLTLGTSLTDLAGNPVLAGVILV